MIYNVVNASMTINACLNNGEYDQSNRIPLYRKSQPVYQTHTALFRFDSTEFMYGTRPIERDLQKLTRTCDSPAIRCKNTRTRVRIERKRTKCYGRHTFIFFSPRHIFKPSANFNAKPSFPLSVNNVWECY
jgi:hypothetical protein